jgi:hypothetical protein
LRMAFMFLLARKFRTPFQCSPFAPRATWSCHDQVFGSDLKSQNAIPISFVILDDGIVRHRAQDARR